MTKTLLLTITLLLTVGIAANAGQDPAAAQTSRSGVRVTIYPILVHAPIFGATIDLPSIPGGGGDGEEGDVTGTTDVSFDAAYMAGLKVEGDRWFADTQGTWAAVSASREAPRIAVDTETVFFSARGGVRLFGGLSATGGVRHAKVSLDATLTLPNLDRTVQGKSEPGLWDPLIGLDWRARGNRWDIEMNFQGGGFGVGSDVDMSGGLLTSLHLGRHVDFRLGYEALYYKFTVSDVNIGRFQRTLVAEQTLHGPTLGIGLVF